MLEIEIDGKPLSVAEGSTVMDAARVVGAYVPHFCYHKKLSIAANCRMCLVEVEKAPKPLPACATPVTNGMKVHTHSEMAVKAQKGVMEFLLINHPLDCPICDQGGECQLQDLAVGYGDSRSRYREEKRVVANKDLGPLVSTDLTRCIQCTRCVRFGQEIAGIMELGMAFRGEHSEIMSFVGRTVDSELSGNMIDLCPVGALTSKPFRFSARTWELSRRRSVSPHDSLGANLVVQVKHDRVMRVLPLENEEVNECWISDKDRFSYEGLNGEQRLTRPMLKQDGKWHEVDWQVALDYAAHALRDIAEKHGPAALGALASPHGTLEELYLLQRLMRGLGSGNVDCRPRQSDFRLDGKLAGAPWLGMTIADLAAADSVLVVGSFLRKDHPLIAQRLRQSVKRGAALNLIHCSADDLLTRVHVRAVVSPADLAGALAQVVVAAAETKGMPIDPNLQPHIAAVRIGEEARRIARSLVDAKSGAVLLGNLAQQHPEASALHLLGQELARLCGARFGVLGEAANSVGGYVAGAVPFGQLAGLNAREMLREPRKGYLLLNIEPELDCYDAGQALAALGAADSVIVLTPFKGRAMEYADCLLPVSPFTETSGTFVNLEGRAQSFNAVVKPLEQTRPGWKVLRVLGSMLGLVGFEFDSSEAVRDAVLRGETPFVASRLGNQAASVPVTVGAPSGGLRRVGEVPIYFADPLVRRAAALQRTRDAQPPQAGLHPDTARQLGIGEGDPVRLRQGGAEAVLPARIDATLAAGCVRVAAGHPATAALGELHGPITVERG
jgi:NADH-quinone oxidoreductase subunit G